MHGETVKFIKYKIAYMTYINKLILNETDEYFVGCE